MGHAASQRALMDATKKRAQRLETKGQSVDFKQLLRMELNGGTTNIRNVGRQHALEALRSVAPFSSFSEFNKTEGGD
jgi:hypothetical protein